MTLVGEPFKGHNPMPNMLKDLANSSNYKERKNIIEKFNKNNKWKKRGIAMVPIKYDVHKFAPMPYYCHISIYMSQYGDGSISVSHGGIEMGQGINTKVAQTVAGELKDYGVTVDMIKVKAANTLVSPNNCVTGGSTTSELTCNVSSAHCLDLDLYG